MRLTLLALAVLIAAPDSRAQPAPQRTQPLDPPTDLNRWFRLGESRRGLTVYLDQTSARRTGHIIDAWVWMAHPDINAQETSEPRHDRSLDRVQINCTARATGIHTRAYYLNKAYLETYQLPRVDWADWVPESLMEGWGLKVCELVP